MMEKHIAIFYLIGFVQSLFVSLLILFKRNKQLSDYMLSFYILVMGFFLGFMYAYESGFYMQNPVVVILDILYWVLIGPALYIYIDLMTGTKQRFLLKHLPHLVPTIIVLIGFSDMFTGDHVKTFAEFKPDSWFTTFAIYVWYYNSPVYYLICIYKLWKHKRNIRNYYSNTQPVDLKWLYFLAYGFAAFLFFGIVTSLLSRFFHIELPFGSKHYSWLVMVLYIFGIGFYGYRQKGIFSETDLQPETNNGTEHSPGLYEKSGLGKEERDEILARLQTYMETHKPYVDSELNLRTLSDALKTTPHKLSQVINEQLNCNFFEYVNHYRVEEAKKALSDPTTKDLKIIAIAYDCGFSSKSTFYTAFKKQTSLTPSEFKNQVG